MTVERVEVHILAYKQAQEKVNAFSLLCMEKADGAEHLFNAYTEVERK
jgi:hypothetical protein